MATYYVRTDGNDSNAGTTDSSGGAWLTLEHAAAAVAAGDTVMVRASAGNASSYPSASLDYNTASFFTPTAGTAASGHVKWIGYNGMPTIGTAGLSFYNCDRQWWEGLYFVATGVLFPALGILNAPTECVVKGCIFNQNSQAAMVGVLMGGGVFENNEIYGGTTSPTTSSGAWGLETNSYTIRVYGNRIHHCRDHGIRDNVNGSQIENNIIYKCVGNGIEAAASGLILANMIISNTINDNQGHGINVSATNGAHWYTIQNNSITNHTQASKVGLRAATSSSDIRKRVWNYNNLYNNTTNYENVTADSTDLSVDPQYTDAANGDFSIGTNLKALGFPHSFLGAATPISYVDIGAVQRAEPTASPAGTNMRGGFAN